MATITIKLTPTQVSYATFTYKLKLNKTQLRQITKVFVTRAARTKSKAKARASRENGKLGGRPKGT